MMEKRRREEVAKKEHKEEEERRRVALYTEEREKKLERACREKSSNGGESRCPEEGKVASLHSVVSITCQFYGLFMNNVVYCWTFHCVVM